MPEYLIQNFGKIFISLKNKVLKFSQTVTQNIVLEKISFILFSKNTNIQNYNHIYFTHNSLAGLIMKNENTKQIDSEWRKQIIAQALMSKIPYFSFSTISINKQKKILKNIDDSIQNIKQNKPELWSKIRQGKINKWISLNCLESQKIFNDTIKISDFLIENNIEILEYIIW